MSPGDVLDLTYVRYNVVAQTLVFESRDPGNGSIVAQSPSPQALRTLEQDHLVTPNPKSAAATSSLPKTATAVSLLV